MERSFDVIVVGGGPAGISAALLLGRCRRRVAVCDDGHPRNRASHASHGFFTRDGEDPQALLRLGREQLCRYDVSWVDATVTAAKSTERGFQVETSAGYPLYTRKLLLATGLVDELPPLDGIAPLYGRSVFHCPFCDGWEVRDQPLAIYGKATKGTDFALALRTWSADLVLCTDGDPMVETDKRRLKSAGIGIREQPIARLVGEDGILSSILFRSGEALMRTALFCCVGTRQRCDLARQLGCEFNSRGYVVTGDFETTCVTGVYVAGDASEDVNFIAIAVAEGMRAGFAIHRALCKDSG